MNIFETIDDFKKELTDIKMDSSRGNKATGKQKTRMFHSNNTVLGT